jgi:putative transcriptional regulator
MHVVDTIEKIHNHEGVTGSRPLYSYTPLADNPFKAELVKEESTMKRRMFDRFLQSVREGGAVLRGEGKAARRIVLGSPEVRAIREKTNLSQSEFAQLIGVSVKTLQNWEQDRRRPTGPAVALLRTLAQEPKLAVEAIHRH